LARLGVLFYFVTSAFYGLLAYNAFTYTQVIQFQLIGWFSAFGRVHHLLYWPFQALAALTLLPALGVDFLPRMKPTAPRRHFVLAGVGADASLARTPGAPTNGPGIGGSSGSAQGDQGLDWGRRSAIGYLAASLVGGFALLWHPVLPALQNDVASLRWALVFLLFPAWLAWVDVARSWRRLPGAAAPDPVRGLLNASLGAALVVAVSSLGLSLTELASQKLARFIEASLPPHLLIGAALFLLLATASGLLVAARASTGLSLVVWTFLLSTLLTLGLRGLVFTPLALTGGAALTASAALAGLLAGTFAGLGLRTASDDELADPLGVLLLPLSSTRLRGAVGTVLRVALPVLVLAVLAQLARAWDWSFLLAKLAAAVAWLLAFAAIYTRPRADLTTPVSSRWVMEAVTACLALLLLSRAAEARAREKPWLHMPEAREELAARDGAFRLLAGPSHAAKQTAAPDRGASLYSYLTQRTNLPPDFPVKPLDVRIAQPLAASTGKKPNIFLFVVDSLRRDYLSPFNPKVSFTPNIEAFAQESDAFSQAFTHYGATGLSEPSIWVGGMMPHKQYITPFAPLNALEKLLQVEGYRQFISMDAILSVVVEPTPGLTRLDAQTPGKDYDFCRTLAELTGKLDAPRPDDAPLFAYTQPQDVHISRINREGRSVPLGEFYPGFDAPYASRVNHFDQCFGQFISHLKQKGLYDDSVVILTADHGDSLGEEGRWGHAYTLYPEVVQIPLLVHLPKALQDRFSRDPKALAFSTDLTPSLYALLGHPPTETRGPFGRSLYLPKGTTNAHEESPELLISSYGPVYGILAGGGTMLYIADAVNFQEEAFELSPGGPGRRIPLTSALLSTNEALLRQKVDELNTLYGVTISP
jgi:hypothetical protein